ncbi:archease [Candidatus Bathyarchaeota archaeon]|nr:archease [Candidatus Bathyarchaeota archaeon]
MSKGYEYLEHTADVYIKATGTSLHEAFENAGKATTEVMTDIDKIKPIEHLKITIEANNLEELLYQWLEEILFRFDAEGLLISDFEVNEIEEDGSHLEGIMKGEEFDPDKHPQRLGVKAATYHMMEIEKNGSFVLKFVLDV